MSAIFAPILAPFGYGQLRDDNGSFGAQQPPSAEHLLGTTVGGYDVLSRVIWGSQTAVLVIIVAVLLLRPAGLFARAERVEIHDTEMTDGVARMRPVEGALAIPAGMILAVWWATQGPTPEVGQGWTQPFTGRAPEEWPDVERREAHGQVQAAVGQRRAARARRQQRPAVEHAEGGRPVERLDGHHAPR